MLPCCFCIFVFCGRIGALGAAPLAVRRVICRGVPLKWLTCEKSVRNGPRNGSCLVQRVRRLLVVGCGRSRTSWCALVDGWNAMSDGANGPANGLSPVASGCGALTAGCWSFASGWCVPSNGFRRLVDGWLALSAGLCGLVDEWSVPGNGFDRVGVGLGPVCSRLCLLAAGWRQVSSLCCPILLIRRRSLDE